MKLFHFWHKFDPDKWVQVSAVEVGCKVYVAGVSIETPTPLGLERVYSNTCTVCGDLIFRRVLEVEP